jgi:hypothetical protein
MERKEMLENLKNSLLDDLQNDDLENIHNLVWSITTKDLLKKVYKKQIDRQNEQLDNIKGCL